MKVAYRIPYTFEPAPSICKDTRLTIAIEIDFLTMAKLLFRLRNVPDDELDDVYALLAEHEIEVYETHAGNWGISLPALWLQDDSQFDQARELIEQYQQERARKAREDYQTRAEQGQADTWFASFRRQPFRVIAFLALAALVAYLSTSAFFF